MKTNILYAIAFATILTSCTGGGEKKTEDTSQSSEVVKKVVGKEVSYKADTTTMNGYIANDESIDGKKPGILVIHEWWGHNEYTRKRADMLAELGYVAMAVDMYGNGKQAAHPEDAGKFSGQVFSNMEGAKARFEAALSTLKSNPNVDTSKIAAIGYCFGGSVALTMANAGYDLDAVAAFHSGVQLPIQPSGNLDTRILVQNGADDPMVSDESVTSFKASMEAANATYEYISYPEAVHAYTNPGATALGEKFGLPLAYNKQADEKSWAKMKSFLAASF
ncbi:MAG: dienelactone hydrolase family protein [Cyclobacteriaceae bacterium]